ncbi:hypothetical protein M3Y96_00770300 [Aphelenchoides besseyi]|nr:hypothetical protein M3Y96_00770300 [Aphelenchoides besseyi]
MLIPIIGQTRNDISSLQKFIVSRSIIHLFYLLSNTKPAVLNKTDIIRSTDFQAFANLKPGITWTPEYEAFFIGETWKYPQMCWNELHNKARVYCFGQITKSMNKHFGFDGVNDGFNVYDLFRKYTQFEHELLSLPCDSDRLGLSNLLCIYTHLQPNFDIVPVPIDKKQQIRVTWTVLDQYKLERN